MAKKKFNKHRLLRVDDNLLYDLDWINEGEQFPPPSQVERLERYEQNKMLFESEQKEVFADALHRIQRIVGDLRNVSIDPVVLNYNKLLSIKTADLVCGEEPKITYDDSSTDVIDEIDKKVNLSKLLYESVIDISRYGDAVWRLYKDDDGKGTITIWEPSEWFPIVNPEDKKKITHHVLARKVFKGYDESGYEKYDLHIQIHYKGYYEKRIYTMKDRKTIGKLVETAIVPTGFKEFAVIHTANVTTSDSIFGHDDYKPVNSIIAELMVRFGQIQKILDKFASPSIKGPLSALQQNPITGRWEFKMANFFATTPEEPDVEYLTWDGQLTSAFTEIEKLIDQLLTISEMGAALLGSIDSAGRATSGTTMRLRMVNPLMKARRIVDSLHNSIQLALSQVSTMGYQPLEKEKIQIEWFDGLPDDPVEEANIMAIRTGNKPTISQKRAIMLLGDMTEEQAEKILQEIKDEEPKFDEFAPMDKSWLNDEEEEQETQPKEKEDS